MSSFTPARISTRAKQIVATSCFAAFIARSAALACACGCAVFDVGTSTLLPNGPGGTIFLEYDFLNQTTNWHGGSSAPSADNDDKHIRSDFMLAGGQYMFNEDWGAMAEVPVTHRAFTRTLSIPCRHQTWNGHLDAVSQSQREHWQRNGSRSPLMRQENAIYGHHGPGCASHGQCF